MWAGRLGWGIEDRVEAFAEWMMVAEPRLRRAFVGVRGPDLAGDAVAEALGYAWEHWDRLQGMENSVGYVFRVGVSRTRVRRTPPLPVPDSIVLPNIEPGLLLALRSLPEKQRTAVWLVHACDWSHGEAAAAMGIKASTVSTHVTRALATLRQLLEQHTDV